MRTRLILGAITVALLWLGLVLPHLLAAWPQVLVFVGIVVAAAWGWGKVAKAKLPSPPTARAETPGEADVDAATARKLVDR